jgi:hypothetical protein
VTVTRAVGVGEPKARGAFLTVTLVITAIANTLAALGGWFAYRDVADHGDPAGVQGALLLAAALAALNLGCVAPLWVWKRWGLYLIAASSVLAFLANLVAGTPFLLSLMGLVGLAILLAAIRPKWRLFR